MSTTKLDSIKDNALAAFKAAPSSKDLYDLKVQYLGKSGSLTEIMKEMASLPKEEKPLFGKKVNEVKQLLEAAYAEAEDALKKKEISAKMAAEEIDMTLPAFSQPKGTAHPVNIVVEEIFTVMSRLGYSIRTGPMIEKDYYNFEALNIPADHPARDMADTFFVDKTHVLRTHTSPIQIHSLENEELPLRVIGTGPVFRCDSDISHLPNFHQIEALCVDEKISMADLKGTISFFVREFFGPGLKTRFRPSYFPFTEPSAEVDCSCPICKGKGCSLCKQSGWIEIGGCGLVNPKVFQAAKIEYPKWQGFAFGFGVERMAIIKYGIEDIRLFPENDVRFLRQFVK
ncbi:Phenylalanine--tRNA ligase alpha subunit [Bdellovibrio bacteriovorus]|uniref:phenylalanine--tRNA ligase subunit alpha n=1 Tax=Bdellovibrio bacteriovorus TaxID=959 RepID=UPI00045BE725|nr:phenylalanine--tRNA ligase subunit alpha [Bdellovibrio bacteriovorus]AHZ84181.1 phenylalanine--tRNA ligase [Bdellovibrio bacteriovorus]BEV68065.1 Phenylalanine--tRNA ligase alpha subunit [Bdellovibrio bacteriovorus]